MLHTKRFKTKNCDVTIAAVFKVENIEDVARINRLDSEAAETDKAAEV